MRSSITMPPSPPPSLSFQLENEALAKARKKNRLAQRKHRQSTWFGFLSVIYYRTADITEPTLTKIHHLNRNAIIWQSLHSTGPENFGRDTKAAA